MLKPKVKITDKINTHVLKEELNKAQNQYIQDVNILIQDMRCKLHGKPPQWKIINNKPCIEYCCDQFADIVEAKINSAS